MVCFSSGYCVLQGLGRWASLRCAKVLWIIAGLLWLQSLPAHAADCAGVVCAADHVEAPLWVDKSHALVGTGVENLVDWFDRFFVTNREQVESGSSYLRVRESLQWEEHQGFDTKTHLRARAQLPNLNKKLSLTFTSDDGPDDEDLPANALRGDEFNDNETLSLQYEVSKTALSRLDFRYHWRSSLDPMVSGRYRRDFIFSEKFLSRFTQILYLANDDGLGEVSRVDLDYLLNKRSVLRWRNKIHYGEETEGVEWLSEVLLARQISDQRALAYFIGMRGETDPYNLVTNYSTGVRFRRNFLRSWLFYEVEPALNWKKENEEDNRELVGSINFRLEVFFGDFD